MLRLFSCQNAKKALGIFLLFFIYLFILFTPVVQGSNLPGVISGKETHFEITDSKYLNVSLESSESIRAEIESIPDMITMAISAVSPSATSTQIKISGFAPLKKYYKYQDDYSNLTEFYTDESGNYSYIQDLSSPHFIFIQPRKSTKFISDNLTGGHCALIGNWDNSAKTCTLTQDVYETIQINDDNITIDGNGHKLNGFGTGFGIYSYGNNGIKVKNLYVSNFTYGINFFYTNNGLIENNDVSYNNGIGINIRSASYNTVVKNTISENYISAMVGLYYGFDPPIGNELYNNNFINNHYDTSVVAGDSLLSYPPPIGGNYWSEFSPTCSDQDNNNICDAPYYIASTTKDDYPWKIQDGWVGAQDQPLSTKAANLTKELINQPYLWGGKSWDYNQNLFVSPDAVKTGYNFFNPNIGSVDVGAGVDCSGLIMWSYDRSFDPFKPAIDNVVLYESADGQYRNNTELVSEENLKPGDLMFFDWDFNNYVDHVAMYVGPNNGFDVVHARSKIEGIRSTFKDNLKGENGFLNFRRVIPKNLGFVATVYSPVELSVTDPDGFIINSTTKIFSEEENIREIPGELYYSDFERGEDGHPISRVYSPKIKNGDYLIKVSPLAGASATSTYSLDYKVGDQIINLAENMPLNQIPLNGYGVSVLSNSGSDTVSSFVPVSIDIKPDDEINTINLKSNGVIPVVIFGSQTFNVRQIDAGAIRLANAKIKSNNNNQLVIDYIDINKDSFIDMIFHVATKDLQIFLNDNKAYLEGKLIDGTTIKGFDSIRIIH